MRRWFEVSPLRDREEGAGGGGSDTTRVVDPGAEHQLDDDDPPEDKPAAKSAEVQRIEKLEKDLEDERKARKDAEEDGRYWAGKAKQAPPPAARRDDDEEQPRRRAAAAEITEKPEELIDDLNKKGLQALKERGFISKAELEEALENEREKTAADISDARSEAVFSGRLESEFPEMMADSERVAKGLAPKSELFIKAGEIYRDLVALDPSLKNSRGLLLIAARQAKAGIEGKGKGKGKDDDAAPSRRSSANDDDAEDQRRRRSRIERQTPDRGKDDEEAGGGAHHSSEQLEVMKRLKVKPEEFNKHRDATRGAKNGRR